MVTDAPQTFSIGEALDEGVKYALMGDHKSASGFFRGVLIHEPQNFEAMNRLGAALFEQQLWHEALYWFWRARKLCPKEPMALTNYGLTLSQLGHYDEALPWIEKAVALGEKAKWFGDAMALLYNNLGNTYERLKRHKEAYETLNRGIQHNPDDPFPYYNRGIALMRLNRHREAIASLDRSIALRHKIFDGSGSRLSEPDAVYNRGMAHLLLGNFKDGWEGYEARLLTTENKQPNMGLPVKHKWEGQDVAGKQVLVHCEQGLGDSIQFMRFVPLLVERGAQVLLAAHRELWPLIGQMDGVELLQPGAPLPGFHYWVALMSLPLWLGIDSEEKIKAVPPWSPVIDHQRKMGWWNKLDLPCDKLSVGVCWHGNFQHKNNAHRSIPLKKFANLFGIDGVRFISVQQMEPEDTHLFPELTRGKDVTALYLTDFQDTAAIIKGLDVIVSVDTSVAHLAATCGRQTIILVPAYSTDWRWQLGRNDSPWYPTATICRQPRIGDWDSVIGQTREVLATYRNYVGIDQKLTKAMHSGLCISV